MENRCKLVKGDINPSSVGGPACEICALGEKIEKTINDCNKLIEESPYAVSIKELKEQLSKLRKNHQTCAGCGLCFGDEHIAIKFGHVVGIGDICQWCGAEHKRLGDAKWNERLAGVVKKIKPPEEKVKES